MGSEDARRDPVEVIRHARQYLKKTRGEKMFERSLAGQILAQAEMKSARCIDYLLNAAMRARGSHCPCDFHEAEFRATDPGTKEKARRTAPLSGKEAAAGEQAE